MNKKLIKNQEEWNKFFFSPYEKVYSNEIPTSFPCILILSDGYNRSNVEAIVYNSDF